MMMVPQVHVGCGVYAGGVTVFPVWTAVRGVRGLDTGVRAQVGAAERAGSPVVGELVLTNEGLRPALLLEGELLEGGWQHRVVVQDLVLAPRPRTTPGDRPSRFERTRRTRTLLSVICPVWPGCLPRSVPAALPATKSPLPWWSIAVCVPASLPRWVCCSRRTSRRRCGSATGSEVTVRVRVRVRG